MFTYSSAKASRLALSTKPRGIAYMFIMHVAEELQKWPEADKRTRLWVSSMRSINSILTLDDDVIRLSTGRLPWMSQTIALPSRPRFQKLLLLVA